jgi:hypothetical protein
MGKKCLARTSRRRIRSWRPEVLFFLFDGYLVFSPFSLEPPVEEEREGKFAYQNSSGILGNQ